MTKLEFVRDDGMPIALSGDFADFVDPAAADMSVLGRDVPLSGRSPPTPRWTGTTTRAYHLDYDETAKATHAREGYFWKEGT